MSGFRVINASPLADGQENGECQRNADENVADEWPVELGPHARHSLGPRSRGKAEPKEASLAKANAGRLSVRAGGALEGSHVMVRRARLDNQKRHAIPNAVRTARAMQGHGRQG